MLRKLKPVVDNRMLLGCYFAHNHSHIVYGTLLWRLSTGWESLPIKQKGGNKGNEINGQSGKL